MTCPIPAALGSQWTRDHRKILALACQCDDKSMIGFGGFFFLFLDADDDDDDDDDLPVLPLSPWLCVILLLY